MTLAGRRCPVTTVNGEVAGSRPAGRGNPAVAQLAEHLNPGRHTLYPPGPRRPRIPVPTFVCGPWRVERVPVITSSILVGPTPLRGLRSVAEHPVLTSLIRLDPRHRPVSSSGRPYPGRRSHAP